MSSATETLCEQAFGAGQDHVRGIYLQRSWIVNFVTVTLFVPIFIFATPMLKVLGQNSTITDTALSIVHSLPLLLFLSLNHPNAPTITTQKHNYCMVISRLVGTSRLLSWIFVYVLHWSVNGAMLSLNIASWFVNMGMLVYVFGAWCPNSWKGFSVAAFRDLWLVIKLSVFSGVMLCLELWYNAILMLLVGHGEKCDGCYRHSLNLGSRVIHLGMSELLFTVAGAFFSGITSLNINIWELMIASRFFHCCQVKKTSDRLDRWVLKPSNEGNENNSET